MRMLEDPEAFRPRARQRAEYESDGDGGRPVLAAALAADSLVSTLMAWAVQMPSFATNLVGASPTSPLPAPSIHHPRSSGAACVNPKRENHPLLSVLRPLHDVTHGKPRGRT